MTDQKQYRSQLSEDGDAGWQSVSPRKEIEPAFAVAAPGFDGEPAALEIRLPGVSGGQGKWVRTLEGIEPGASYRLTVRFQTRDVPDVRGSVYARLVWQGAGGRALSHDKQEYYAVDPGTGSDGSIGGVRVAPAEAQQAQLQLVAAWAPGGVVRFGGVEWARTEAPAPRTITVATVYRQPKPRSTPEANVELYAEMIDRAGAAGADVCVLPEAITVVAVADRTPADVAEPVPGPISERLGEHARRARVWVVACYPERDGANVYNTAILLDREGRLAGRYRKTHLPNEEVDNGYTPGSDYPVFDTDFGRVGMMVCWDVAFPEPARALAVAGAEVLLMPIWGGNETLMAARAIENAVYLVTSSYNSPTGIIDPLGQWLSVIRPADDRDAAAEGQLALATIDLGDRRRWDWVGDFSERWQIERRPDLAGALGR